MELIDPKVGLSGGVVKPVEELRSSGKADAVSVGTSEDLMVDIAGLADSAWADDDSELDGIIWEVDSTSMF